jgi:DNA-binding MarR family transcriptional regulator/N-acetylglutamate synthase-like GNAT family acetyltransferase
MVPTPSPEFEQRIAAVRSFNRFYTRQIGLLQDGLLQSQFSLAEARVLYELAHRNKLTATEISSDLGLDQGYLSRMLRRLAERNYVVRTASPTDRRQNFISLTTRGRLAFGSLDQRSQAEIGKMLGAIAPADQGRLTAAMAAIEALLGKRRLERPAYVLRPHRPGDMGWVVARHGALYAEEYGWDISFEGLVAEIVAEFIKTFDTACEHCWIGEIDGAPVGCVFLVKKSDTVAKLRLLLVERQARGLGIGARLVEECIRFARSAGYRTITLWTQSILVGARRIYERAGFKRVAQEPHASFGQKLLGETWEITL